MRIIYLSILAFIVTLFLAPQTRAASTVADMLADRSMGLASAPVTIIEYSSLTCPHCAEFDSKTLPQLKTDYVDTGKVRFISRDYPLDKVALNAAMMARCAPAENYFPLIDLLFKGQDTWARATDPTAGMTPLGKFAGLSDKEIKDCLANDELQKGIVAERADAEKKYGIDGTPAFIFNGGAQKFSGAESYDKFKTTIDALLAKK